MRDIKYIQSVPDKYDFENNIYVWDNFLEQEISDAVEYHIVNHTSWTFTNKVTMDHCSHTLWGVSYVYEKPEYIEYLIHYLEDKSKIKILDPDYIGLNAQTKGMDACPHHDCELEESFKNVSFLYYVGYGDTNGNLQFFTDLKGASVRTPDKLIGEVEFIKNRVVIFDGSIFHGAKGPNTDTLRISFVYRGYCIL